MAQHGASRFVGISGAGIDVPGDHKGSRDKAISFLIQRLSGAVVADKPAEYREFAATDLDWTLVRPPRLVDGPPTGKITHDAHTPGRSNSIRRADLAAFLADVVEGNLYSRQAPFVSAERCPVTTKAHHPAPRSTAQRQMPADHVVKAGPAGRPGRTDRHPAPRSGGNARGQREDHRHEQSTRL